MTVQDKVDAMDSQSGDQSTIRAHSHRMGGAGEVKPEHLGNGSSSRRPSVRANAADEVLRALDDEDGIRPTPSARPRMTTLPPLAFSATNHSTPDPSPRSTSEPASPQGAKQPTSVLAFEDLLLRPSFGTMLGGSSSKREKDDAGSATPASQQAAADVFQSSAVRAENLERAVFGTASDHELHGGGRWPASLKLSQQVHLVNRWGWKSKAELEVEQGQLRYSRRVYKPAELTDMVYDKDKEHRSILLYLEGRSRPKRVICEDHASRETLSNWLGAWKLGVHPDSFRSMAATGTFGDTAGDGTPRSLHKGSSGTGFLPGLLQLRQSSSRNVVIIAGGPEGARGQQNGKALLQKAPSGDYGAVIIDGRATDHRDA